MKKNTDVKKTRNYALLLIVGGLLGLFAATMLTIEKIQLLQNPASDLACDINPIVACGPVINTDQANVFGFPNPLIGVASFPVIITVGAMILAGAKFKRWFWLGMQIGTALGLIFVHWLIFQTMYRIGALCPYCMMVWAVTIPMFVYTTAYNVRTGNLKLKGWAEKAGAFVEKYPAEIVAVWFLIIIGLILDRFWYYWSTLL